MSDKIEVSVGFTRNMGNFESLRIDIGAQETVPEGQSKGEAIDNLYSRLEKKLVDKVSDATQELIEMDANFREELTKRK